MIKLYTAGRMAHSAVKGAVAEWRRSVERCLADYGMEFLHPELVGCDHGGIDAESTVEKDIEAINKADMVLAYFDRDGLTATIAEVMYAISQKKKCIVIFDTDRLPRVYESDHGCYCLWQNGPVGSPQYTPYWFFEYFLRLHHKDVTILRGGLDVLDDQKIIIVPTHA